MAFDKIERRFRRRKSEKRPIICRKIRPLAYCSNRDACVFGYYAYLLESKYEYLINTLGISDVVIGYRKVGSNIDLALQAFTEVATRGSCIAFAFDISSFFDHIDHGVLKRNWCRVLGVSRLPQDHFVIFERLTKFSTVNRRACLRRLGKPPSSRDRDLDRPPVCSVEVFRNKIDGQDGNAPSLVIPWLRDYRIPQGTPLSALAANISMIEFDVQMKCAVTAMGGSYRRYSDDLLIIVPVACRALIPGLVQQTLKTTTRRLRINDKKTETIDFIPGALASGKGTRHLQYLGFLFDGERVLLRSTTISKYYRRLHAAVRVAKRQHRKAKKGELPGRMTLHLRSLYADQSHLGVNNFVTSYAAKSEEKMRSPAIKKQLARAPKKLAELIARPR